MGKPTHTRTELENRYYISNFELEKKETTPALLEQCTNHGGSRRERVWVDGGTRCAATVSLATAADKSQQEGHRKLTLTAGFRGLTYEGLESYCCNTFTNCT